MTELCGLRWDRLRRDRLGREGRLLPDLDMVGFSGRAGRIGLVKRLSVNKGQGLVANFKGLEWKDLDAVAAGLAVGQGFKGLFTLLPDLRKGGIGQLPGVSLSGGAAKSDMKGVACLQVERGVGAGCIGVHG